MLKTNIHYYTIETRDNEGRDGIVKTIDFYDSINDAWNDRYTYGSNAMIVEYDTIDGKIRCVNSWVILSDNKHIESIKNGRELYVYETKVCDGIPIPSYEPAVSVDFSGCINNIRNNVAEEILKRSL